MVIVSSRSKDLDSRRKGSKSSDRRVYQTLDAIRENSEDDLERSGRYLYDDDAGSTTAGATGAVVSPEDKQAKQVVGARSRVKRDRIKLESMSTSKTGAVIFPEQYPTMQVVGVQPNGKGNKKDLQSITTTTTGPAIQPEENLTAQTNVAAQPQEKKSRIELKAITTSTTGAMILPEELQDVQVKDETPHGRGSRTELKAITTSTTGAMILPEELQDIQVKDAKPPEKENKTELKAITTSTTRAVILPEEHWDMQAKNAKVPGKRSKTEITALPEDIEPAQVIDIHTHGKGSKTSVTEEELVELKKPAPSVAQVTKPPRMPPSISGGVITGRWDIKAKNPQAQPHGQKSDCELKTMTNITTGEMTFPEGTEITLARGQRSKTSVTEEDLVEFRTPATSVVLVTKDPRKRPSNSPRGSKTSLKVDREIEAKERARIVLSPGAGPIKTNKHTSKTSVKGDELNTRNSASKVPSTTFVEEPKALATLTSTEQNVGMTSRQASKTNMRQEDEVNPKRSITKVPSITRSEALIDQVLNPTPSDAEVVDEMMEAEFVSAMNLPPSTSKISDVSKDLGEQEQSTKTEKTREMGKEDFKRTSIYKKSSLTSERRHTIDVINIAEMMASSPEKPRRQSHSGEVSNPALPTNWPTQSQPDQSIPTHRESKIEQTPPDLRPKQAQQETRPEHIQSEKEIQPSVAPEQNAEFKPTILKGRYIQTRNARESKSTHRERESKSTHRGSRRKRQPVAEEEVIAPDKLKPVAPRQTATEPSLYSELQDLVDDAVPEFIEEKPTSSRKEVVERVSRRRSKDSNRKPRTSSKDKRKRNCSGHKKVTVVATICVQKGHCDDEKHNNESPVDDQPAD